MTIIFTIPGKPTAKQRPRHFTSKGKTYTYTPVETKEFEQKVREAYIAQCNHYFEDKPVEAVMTFVYEPTPSWSKKEKLNALNGTKKMTQKPDVDNLVKSILDSLNGVAYKDDSQVVSVTAIKKYGEKAGTLVWLKGVKE